MEKIHEENVFIKGLVDLIPPRLYFDAESLLQINAVKHAHVDKFKQTKGKKMSVGNKQLWARLDPEIPKTVSELQNVLASLEENPKLTDPAFANGDASNADSIQGLREKLNTKLTELRGKRKHESSPSKKEKNRAKRQKVKLKGKPNWPIITNGGVSNAGPSTQMHADGGEMEFGKLEFSEQSETEKKPTPYSGRNYKHMLQKVQKRNERLGKLQERDEGKADQVIKAKAWETAMMKAKGIKIKDDVGMLKKAAKKQASKVKKSKKEWQERENSIKMQQEKIQKRRKANIKARKDEKIKNKMKKSIKKGRALQ